MTILQAWEKNARLERIDGAVLREHARRLAESLRVTVHDAPRDYAVVRYRLVYGPRIVDEASYSIRLHEIGHCLTPAAEMDGVTVKLPGNHRANTAGEAGAWRWARANALVWTPRMQSELNRCLSTYRPYAKYGLRDRIWSELERVDGRLTIGHAHHQLQTIGRLKVIDARQRLATVTR